jgi:hypothetical protein
VSEREVTNRMMLRAQDAIDRNSEADRDLVTLAGIAVASRAHFVRTFLQVEKPLLSTVLFPIYLAIAAWGGLYLRNEQLRKRIRGIIKRTSPQGTVLATTKGVQA